MQYLILTLYFTFASTSTFLYSSLYLIINKRLIFTFIAPLLKVLGESARSLMKKYQTPNCNTLSDIWYKLIGVELPQEQLYSTNPPLLMRDPASLLLQLVLLLPTLEHG